MPSTLNLNRLRPAALRGVLVACVALVASAGDSALRFAPTEGTTQTKTILSDATIELDTLELLVDGQDMAAMFGAIEALGEFSRTIEVTDTFGPISEGSPERLWRTFDEIAGLATGSYSAGGESGTVDSDASSEIEGFSVVFTRSDDGYDIVFADGEEGDVELLEGLEEDMDVRFLLPTEPVAEGDTWEVSLRGFDALLRPGGVLHLGSADDTTESSDDDAYPPMQDAIDEVLEGTCTCTFTGVSEEDDRRLAEIRFEFVVAAAVDMVEMIDESMSAIDEFPDGLTPDFEFADLNVDLDVSGVMVWDLDANLVHSLELTGEGELAIDIGVSLEMEGQSTVAEASVEVSITVTHSIATE